MVNVLVRFGELTLKSDRSRRRFLRILIRNIRDALESEGIKNYRIENLWSRLIIRLENLDEIPDSLTRVFGIKSLSPIIEHEFSTLSELVSIGESVFKEYVKGKTFAVRARRTGNHGFTSMDIAKELGARLYSYSNGVDLKNPDVEVFVEVRGNKAFFFMKSIECYGGLPIGTEGRVISLISGGLDSPVASWYMLKRGAEVHYLFLNLDGEEYLEKLLSVVKVLSRKWSYGYQPILYAIPGERIVEEVFKTREDYWNVILKRILYRLAEKMAYEFNAESIITGESLGQVSSQTLRNLLVSQEAVKIPINRPLFGMDKEEIISVARKIGTYDYSIQVKEYCALVPEKPVLRASLKVVHKEEEKIDFKVVDKAYEERRIYNLRALS